MLEEGGGCRGRWAVWLVANEVVPTPPPLLINLAAHCPFVCPGEITKDGDEREGPRTHAAVPRTRQPIKGRKRDLKMWDF